MTSRDPQRCCEAVRSAILATAWLLVKDNRHICEQTTLLLADVNVSVKCGFIERILVQQTSHALNTLVLRK